MSKKDFGSESFVRNSLDDIILSINKTYKSNVVGKASDILVKTIPRIVTGIFPFDLATGGGIPVGRFSMFVGTEGSGKTNTALITVAKAQRTCKLCHAIGYDVVDDKSGEVTVQWDHDEDCGWADLDGTPGMRCVWIDVEGTLVLNWASTLGVDVDELYINIPDYAEQAVDIVDAMLRSGSVDLVVLDSIAAMIPYSEVEKSAEQSIIGDHAMLMNSAFRRWNSAMQSAGRATGIKPTIILINQIREKVGVMFGSPETSPGGKGQLFFPGITIRFSSGQPKMSAGTLPKTLRWVSKFKVSKSKVGMSRLSGEYELAVTSHESYVQGDVVDYDEVLKMAKDTGLIVQDGKKWVYTNKDVCDKEFRVLGDVVESWHNNFRFYWEVKLEVLRRCLDALA